ncbi:MAG: hypothetical protein HY880_05680 [Deltaproteobacteria bacterium]|nr:hypothetical protein [Deltaproteobacteria bacterium]
MSAPITIQAITENLRTVLSKEGLYFSVETYEGMDQVPASLLPLGQIFYKGETFEYTHGQRPGYINAGFLLRVILRMRSPEDAVRDEEQWVHRIKTAITVNALNINELALTKYVSRVMIGTIGIENKKEVSIVNMNVEIRYREV